MPAEWKIKEVEGLKELIGSYPVVGIVGIRGIPASQMHEMRKNLGGNAIVRVSKNSLIQHALADEDNLSKLSEYIEGESAVLATDMNPFKIFRQLEKTKMKVPAKGGEIAPDDIVVEKGKTPFKPGPIVGEFQKAGIPAAIREGSVVVEKTVTLVKKGEIIQPHVAQMLTRMDVYPLEVGLNVRAIYEDGLMFTSETLGIDVGEISSNFHTAIHNAFALSLELKYPAKEIVPQLLHKAYCNSFTLALECGMYTPDTIKEFIKNVHRQVSILAKELKTEGE
ncbi:MAG: 50S ribosomal protein L10 [Candidatus Thermoplasmatota archaeon]|nr:50S ribosomal protein L10 [Candidatus Thermoplasmatota archaeon]